MPVRTGTTPRQAYRAAKEIITDIQTHVPRVLARLDADVTADFIVKGCEKLRGWKLNLQSYVGVPGLDAYVQSADEENDPAYVFTTECNALILKLQAAIDGIVADIPNDGTYALIVTIAADGQTVWRTLPAASAAVAGFKADLQDILAEVS